MAKRKASVSKNAGVKLPEKKAKKETKSSGQQIVPAQRDSDLQLQSTSEEESNVVYLGHIPHGFYEHQIKGYFSQFGDVAKVRVSRSKTTGKAKGYAFLQFESAKVAKIAAEAMHDYLMFGQKLVCKLVPLSEVHPQTFKGANRRFKNIPWHKIESERHNKERTDKEENKRQKRLISKDKKRNKKIADAGIEYEFKGYTRKSKVKSPGIASRTRSRKKVTV